jgi:hypothetical protein
VSFGRSRRIALPVVGITCAALIWITSSASAAVTIGSDLPGSANGSINCSATCTALTVQHPVNPVSSPIDGVIVRWRSRFGEAFVGARLRVLSVSGNSVTGIRTGPPTNLPAGLQESSMNPGLPISSGEMVGIDLTDPMLANVLRSRPMANVLWRASGIGDGAMAPAASIAGNEVLVNADVEPDCDSDGLGDETQDPSTDCEPPDTTITEGPKDKVKTKKKRARVSFAFVSSEPGSSFECSLDGGPFAPCTSPVTEKVKAKPKAKPHEFGVRATDPAGNVDPTPATDEFKAKRKRGR